jgi:hypothetical protein
MLQKAGDRADRQPVGLARQRRKRVKGPENIGRTVDEEEMIVFFHGARISAQLAQGPSWFFAANGIGAAGRSRNGYQIVIFGNTSCP